MKTLRTTKVKARKEHQCDYCIGTINKGEIYENSTNVGWDGDMYTWKSHLSCIDIAQKLKMFEGAYDGLTSDNFIEIVKDNYDTLYQDGKKHPKFQVMLTVVKDKYLNQ